MAQITIYLDQDTAKQMRQFVNARHISQSKWIAELIRERLSSEWPDHIIELAGAWSDLPTGEDLRQDLGQDVPREPF